MAVTHSPSACTQAAAQCILQPNTECVLAARPFPQHTFGLFLLIYTTNVGPDWACVLYGVDAGIDHHVRCLVQSIEIMGFS